MFFSDFFFTKKYLKKIRIPGDKELGLKRKNLKIQIQ